MTNKEMKETIRKLVNDNWYVLKLIIGEYGTDSFEANIITHSFALSNDLWNILFPDEDWSDEQ